MVKFSETYFQHWKSQEFHKLNESLFYSLHVQNINVLIFRNCTQVCIVLVFNCNFMTVKREKNALLYHR